MEGLGGSGVVGLGLWLGLWYLLEVMFDLGLLALGRLRLNFSVGLM